MSLLWSGYWCRQCFQLSLEHRGKLSLSWLIFYCLQHYTDDYTMMQRKDKMWTKYKKNNRAVKFLKLKNGRFFYKNKKTISKRFQIFSVSSMRCVQLPEFCLKKQESNTKFLSHVFLTQFLFWQKKKKKWQMKKWTHYPHPDLK